MRNCLTILLNIVFKKDLEVLYGKGTMVEINDCKYCTTTKDFLIDCTLKVGSIELFQETQLDGLNYLCCTFQGTRTIYLICSNLSPL